MDISEAGLDQAGDRQAIDTKDRIALGTLVRACRSAHRGEDILYHGTRHPLAILIEGAFCCNFGVSFSRDPDVAAYWALLERDDDEGIPAVFCIDRRKLRWRHSLRPLDDAWSCGLPDEMEERCLSRRICHLDTFVLSVVIPPRYLQLIADLATKVIPYSEVIPLPVR